MPSERFPVRDFNGAACRACLDVGISWLCPDSPEARAAFEERLMARDEGADTGSAGELVDLMGRLLRL